MKCMVCGTSDPRWLYTEPVDDVLMDSWGISSGMRDLFNYREGTLCNVCGVNLRAMQLAEATMKYYGLSGNFSKWISWVNQNRLKVAEINSCHRLHGQLEKVKELTYSDYGGGHAEDIQNLSYDDETFDLVLHSETLEHVPDPVRALNECRRVLKEDGAVIFTIPLIWNKKTRQRATLVKNKIKNLLPASYHGYNKPDYLVFWEFGRDFVRKTGCQVLWFDAQSQNYILLAYKQKYHIPVHEVLKYRVLEKYFTLKQRLKK